MFRRHSPQLWLQALCKDGGRIIAGVLRLECKGWGQDPDFCLRIRFQLPRIPTGKLEAPEKLEVLHICACSCVASC